MFSWCKTNFCNTSNTKHSYYKTIFLQKPDHPQEVLIISWCLLMHCLNVVDAKVGAFMYYISHITDSCFHGECLKFKKQWEGRNSLLLYEGNNCPLFDILPSVSAYLISMFLWIFVTVGTILIQMSIQLSDIEPLNFIKNVPVLIKIEFTQQLLKMKSSQCPFFVISDTASFLQNIH